MRVLARVTMVVLTILMLSACGRSLSRSDAETALRSYSDANPPTSWIALDDVVSWKDGFFALEGKQPMDTSNQRGCWRQLASQGALSEPKLQQHLTKLQREGWRALYYSVEVANPAYILETAQEEIEGSGRKLLAREVRVVTARRSITSIDGVTEPAQTMSMVKFTYSEEGTGFHNAYCTTSRNLWESATYKPSAGPQHGMATFVLYDDGWKLERVDW